MKFQKLNDNVIRCIFTKEEMQLSGINIDDLMGDHAKAEEFLQYVLSKAKNEADFVTRGDVLNVQLSVLRDGAVSMMISDDQHAAIKAIAEQFKEKLREFSKALEAGGQLPPPEVKKPVKSVPKDSDFTSEKVINFLAGDGDGDVKDLRTYSFWARLSDMDDCISLAAALESAPRDSSDLYKYYGEYYLCINMTLTKSQTAGNIFTMSEYSDDVSSDNSDYLMVAEHGELLIKGDALEKLIALSK